LDLLSFLYLPFLAGLILTGIHAYLGVHVVERGVIFVDLSLAQIAALGTTIAVLYGIDPHGPGAYAVSLASPSSAPRSSPPSAVIRRGFLRKRSSASAMRWPAPRPS